MVVSRWNGVWNPIWTGTRLAKTLFFATFSVSVTTHGFSIVSGNNFVYDLDVGISSATMFSFTNEGGNRNEKIIDLCFMRFILIQRICGCCSETSKWCGWWYGDF